MIQFKHQSKKKSVQLALQNCLSESEHHVLTQEEVEEEAVLWANLKRNLANKAVVCLHKLSLMLLTDAVIVLWERNREQWTIFCSRNGPRVLQPRICDRLICADDIPEGHLTLTSLIVSEGFVSNDNTGGEGSGLGDVGNEVIADDDVA